MIDVPGATHTVALGINARGHIVGMYVTQGTGAELGFVSQSENEAGVVAVAGGRA